MKKDRKEKVKKCNFCETTENLCVDKLGRVHNICNTCKIEQSDKGRKTQELGLQKKNHPYIIRSKKGSILNIKKEFFELEYINKKVLLEDLAKQYQTIINILRKYLLLYSIEEYHICRYCGTKDNLLFMEGRICNCCSSCWKETYKDRKYHRIEKKRGVLNTTSGIGIKAQFLFQDFEKELHKRSICYDELVYGFYDIKNRKRIKSEKSFKMKEDLGKRNGRRKFVDCYLKINSSEYIIEFDEAHHNEDKNYINDIKREREFYDCYPNIKILRISEKMLKYQGKDSIINYLIEAILNSEFNLFRSINDNYLHDCFVDQEFDKHLYN